MLYCHLFSIHFEHLLCPALLDMEFSWQEYQSGVPFPSPGDLPNPEMEPMSLTSPALAGVVFTTSTTWQAQLLGIEDTVTANANMFS